MNVSTDWEQTHPLSARVDRMCATVTSNASSDDPIVRAAEAVRERLRGPLRLVIAGRISKGKSTLVNALLLGSAVALVGAGETTNVVTEFSAGNSDEAVVYCRDGTQRPVDLVDGQLPEDLGVPLEQVGRVLVSLSCRPLLEHITLIDTPGLAGLHEGATKRTREALKKGAEALLFVLDREDSNSASVIAEFSDVAASAWASAVNVIAVLGRVDQLDSDGDPWEPADRISKRLASHAALRNRVSVVIPLITKLAEVACAHLISPDDVDWLRALAGLDRRDRTILLAAENGPGETSPATSPYLEALFRRANDAIPQAKRKRLVELLGVYGLNVAIESVSASPEVESVTESLRRSSGIDQLVEVLEKGLRGHVDALKARRAIDTLAHQAQLGVGPTYELLRNGLEELDVAPAMHPLREIWALSRRSAGVRISSDLNDLLDDLARGNSAVIRLNLAQQAGEEEILSAAAERANRAQRALNHAGASQEQKLIAEIVQRSFSLIGQPVAS